MQKTETAKRWLRGVYGADPAVVDELGSEDVLITYPIFASLFGTPILRGNRAVKEFAVGFHDRWSEIEVVFHETIAEGNRVVLMWSFKGRNVGAARKDSEPTNEIHRWGGITLIRFNDQGKISAEIGEESEPGPMERLSAVEAR